MIGNVRCKEGSGYAGNFRDLFRDCFQARLPFFRERIMIFTQVQLQSFDHADDLFLPNLLSTTERIFVRTIVK